MEKLKNSKPLILLLITGAVFLFLKYIAPLVAPVLTAMLFVTIFGNLLKKMQDRLRLHRQVGAMLLLLFAILILTLLIWILFSWVVGSLPSWLDKLDLLEKDMTVIIQGGCEAVGRALGVDNVYLEEILLSTIEDGIDYFQLKVLPGMVSHSLGYVKSLGVLGGFLVTFIIAVVLLAKDYDAIMNRMLDREEYHVLLEVICGIIRYIATFVKAQAIIMASSASLAALVLGISGIQQGVLWGMTAGFLDVFPFVGTGIVLLPLAIVQLFQGYYGKAIACVVLYVGCIFLREILEPRLIGKRIGVNPIAVLVSLYAGIQLFGISGIIKGPLGFMIIYQTYLSLQKRWQSQELQYAEPEEYED